ERLRAAIENQREHLDMFGLQLGFGYETGALVADGSERPMGASPVRDFVPTTRPGSRVPHAWVERARERLSVLDLLPSGGFTVLGLTRAGTPGWRGPTGRSIAPDADVPAPLTDELVALERLEPGAQREGLPRRRDAHASLDADRPRPAPQCRPLHHLRPGGQRVVRVDAVTPDARLVELETHLFQPARAGVRQLDTLADPRADDVSRCRVPPHRPLGALLLQLDVRRRRRALGRLEGVQPFVLRRRDPPRQLEGAGAGEQGQRHRLGRRPYERPVRGRDGEAEQAPGGTGAGAAARWSVGPSASAMAHQSPAARPTDWGDRHSSRVSGPAVSTSRPGSSA